MTSHDDAVRLARDILEGNSADSWHTTLARAVLAMYEDRHRETIGRIMDDSTHADQVRELRAALREALDIAYELAPTCVEIERIAELRRLTEGS